MINVFIGIIIGFCCGVFTGVVVIRTKEYNNKIKTIYEKEKRKNENYD